MITNNMQMIASYLLNRIELAGYAEIEDDIKALKTWLFDFDVPFYNQEKLDAFLENWIRHFYMREIAYETSMMFKMRVRDVFCRILPQYNKMLELLDTDFDLMMSTNITDARTKQNTMDRDITGSENKQKTSTVDTTNTSTENRKENGTTTIEDQKSSADAFSDTPEGNLSNVDNLSYLSDYRKIVDKGDQKTTHGKGEDRNSNSTQNVQSSGGETNQSSRKDIYTLNETLNYSRKGANGKYLISDAYYSYYTKMKSAIDLFYSDCDKILFLHVWEI